MSTSAEGIVENATTFTGMVRSCLIYITLMNEDDEAIPNAKCKITLQDGQTLSVESDDKGVIEFIKKTKGEFEIELLEEEEANTESSESED